MPLPHRITDFLDRLKGADRSQSAQLVRQLTHRVPRYFYKYWKSTGKGIEGAVLRSEFFLSAPKAFNDPFEMQAKIVYEGTETEKILSLRRSARSTGVPLKDAIRVARLMYEGKAEMAESLHQAYQLAIQEFGVFCLSDAGPRDILMWSHYADHHKGVCLIFHSISHADLFVKAFPVDYSDDYTRINWVNWGQQTGQLKSVILKKSSCWNYEKEFRMIEPSAAGRVLKFKPSALIGMVIGAAAGPSEVANVIDLCEQRDALGLPKIKLFRAKLAGDSYSLKIVRTIDLESLLY